MGNKQDTILVDINRYYEEFRRTFEEEKATADQAWKTYVASTSKKELAELKLLYAEALQKGRSIDWAEAKIDERHLNTEGYEEELKNLKKLFTI